MVRKTFKKISESIYEKIINCGCDTWLWYIEKSMEYDKAVSKKNQKKIAVELIEAIQKKKLDYDIETKCPVIFLDNPINSVDRLYLQNIITTDFINECIKEHDEDKAERMCLSYLFGCDEDIISQMNETDYKIAQNMLNLIFLV